MINFFLCIVTYEKCCFTFKLYQTGKICYQHFPKNTKNSKISNVYKKLKKKNQII